MKSIPIAAIAVFVLWIGLSSFWMAGSGVAQHVASASEPQTGRPAPQACAMMTSMRGGSDGTAAMMPGSGKPALPQSMMQQSDATLAGRPTAPPATQGLMTEPVAPMLAVQDLFPTPPPVASDVLTRLQAVEDRLAAVLDRLETTGSRQTAPGATPAVDAQAGIQPNGSWPRQLLSVIASGPVIGFLLLLLVLLAITPPGRSVLQRMTTWLHRSEPTGTASTDEPQFPTALSQNQTLAYWKWTGLDTPQGRTAHWIRFLAKADRLQRGLVAWSLTLLAQMGLVQKDAGPGTTKGSAPSPRIYGDVIHVTDAHGKALQAGVFDEGHVRAAAGLTLALGAVAFGYAYFAQIYAPIQIVTTLFFFEFLIRVTLGIRYSPVGMIAQWLTRRQPPQWVSAKPKQFAWTLGLVMSLAMMILTNSGIRGPLPLTICLICLTLMWLEAVLGLCLGCEIHRFLVRRGWAERDEAYEICANGACVVASRT